MIEINASRNYQSKKPVASESGIVKSMLDKSYVKVIIAIAAATYAVHLLVS